MALDFSKYESMEKEEPKLPILFLINEKVASFDWWNGGMYHCVVRDIISNLNHASVETEIAVISFGDSVNFCSGFKKYEDYKETEWPNTKDSGKSSFKIALAMAKDVLLDVDTTPEGNYDPVVILISSAEATPGYEKALADFKNIDRFKNIQTLGIVDIEYGKKIGTVGDVASFVGERTPKILHDFAENNVIGYINDESDYNESYYSQITGWRKTENSNGETWFCPVLNYIQLRLGEECSSIPGYQNTTSEPGIEDWKNVVKGLCGL